MIKYIHIKSGFTVTRDENAVAFRGDGVGDHSIKLPNNIVEDSNEWTRVYDNIQSYPAELVEPLFNCRMEHYEIYVEKLQEYKTKVERS
jgi:hypothetical protein